MLATDPLYKPIDGGGGDPPAGWQPPAAARDPDAAEFLRLLRHGGPNLSRGRVTVSWGPSGGRNDNALLFLHERTTPGGEKRLVAVRVKVGHAFNTYARDVHQRVWERSVDRLLTGDAWEVSADGTRPDQTGSAERSIVLPDTRRDEIGVTPLAVRDGGVGAVTKLRKANVVRFLAGQPDPADASRFTIPYTIDGRPGVIDGHVGDAGLLLRPREGKGVGDGRGVGWDLRATPPASAPSTLKR